MADRALVSSSIILSIGYDEQSQTLEVEFQTGSVYQYYNVPRLEFDNLMSSMSKGQHLNTYIKPVYPYSKVG